MRIVLFISLVWVTLLSSCGSNEKPIEKEIEQLTVDSISLIVIEDNQSLKDSIAFNELIDKILLNRENNLVKEGPNAFISDDIYKMVYQTPDSIVPLSRKMDLIQMLVFFYNRTTDYYVNFISHRIRGNSDEVKKRPFLLLPFIREKEISPEIVKCILDQDSIQVPTDYYEYSCEVNNYLNTLPKNNPKEALKKIKTDYAEDPNTGKFFSKAFQAKYKHLPRWIESKRI